MKVRRTRGGGYGWAIVDWEHSPPRLARDYKRSEVTQARLVTELLDTFDAAHVDGAFVFTFVMPKYPSSDDPQYDLDLASYGIVKSYADRTGVSYPGMSWHPKDAFGAVAAHYART
jgi:hypothetical protein